MTKAEILQKQRDEQITANSEVIIAFKNLKRALINATYTFDKASTVSNAETTEYIKLSADLEQLFTTYCKIYATVEKQTGHVGFLFTRASCPMDISSVSPKNNLL